MVFKTYFMHVDALPYLGRENLLNVGYHIG